MKYTLSFMLPLLITSIVSLGQTNADYKDVDTLIKTGSMMNALDASNLLKKNYQKDTLNGDYWLRYSQISYVLYKYEDAKGAINKAIQIEPKANYYFEKGILFNRLNLMDTALKALEMAVKIKEEGEYYYWKGIVNQQLGNKQATENDYRLALAHHFETPQLQNNFAILLTENGKFQEALLHINRAISLNDKYAEAYGARARIRVFLFDVDSACIDNASAYTLGFKRILPIPDSVCKGSYIQKTQFTADMCAGNKYYQQAIIAYTELINKNVIKSDYFLNRGFCYYQLANYPKAETDYLKALARPDAALDLAYNNLSLLYFDQKDYSKSAEYATKRIELNAMNHVAYLDRGLAHRKMKAYKEAEKDYDKAISIKPDFFRAYAYKAFLNLERGQFEKALELSSTAININPQYGYAYLVRAQVKQKMGIPDFCMDYYSAKSYGEPDATEGVRLYCK